VLVARMQSRGADEETRSQVQSLAQSAGALSRETNGMMRQLVTLSNEQRQLKMQRERLLGELMNVLNRLQSTQRRAEGYEKESMRRVAAAGDPQQQETSLFGEAIGSQHMQQKQLDHQVSLNELRQRQEAINQLEQDIVDVNQIFSDLSRLVHEQGDMVDSIEANVEHTTISVQQGNANITQAVHYQAKARQKRICLFVFLVALVLILLLSIYFYVKG